MRRFAPQRVIFHWEGSIESKSWLEADLVRDLPEYDWGEGGIPSMKPVEYVSGVGLVVKAGWRF